MDSFFEGPRNAPEPISIEKFAYRPSVPEVSMICNNKTPIDNFCHNDSWKRHHQTEKHDFQQNCVPGGYRNLQEQFSKKQVRFESPVLQEKPAFNYPHCKKPVEANHTDFGEFSAARKQQLNVLKSNSPKPFERIYMANIPDRKLDLSLLDIPKPIDNKNIHSRKEINEFPEKYDNNDDAEVKKDETLKNFKRKNDVQVENKENCMPKTYHDFLELQKKMTIRKHKEHNDSVTDIFNYKKTKQSLNNDSYSKNDVNIVQKSTDNQILYDRYHDYGRYQRYRPADTNLDLVKHKYDSETQTDVEDDANSRALQNKKDCEPSNTDLLKIIAQQNEQLLLLQRQVAMLLDRETKYPKSIEAPTEPVTQKNDNRKYSNSNASTPQKNHFRQENTITQQAGIFQDNQRKWGMSKFSINLTTSFEMPMRGQQKQHFVNHEPKIQELTESDMSPKTDNLEPSFRLQEPLNVREECPSPQPSININMNDYESSDDEELVSEIGATFYNNLMGQVNNMLKKAKIETNGTSEDENKKSRMLNKVKEATLKHLKSIGISVESYEVPDKEISNNYTPSEISCTVKQLLMKYLPADYHKKHETPVAVQKEPGQAFLAARPEFSIASLEYMRKYNLIPSKDTVPDFVQPVKAAQQQDWNRGDNRRILDLTALKMQPKLM